MENTNIEHPHPDQQGHTLLELLLMITLVTLLCLGSLPNFKSLLTRVEQEIALDRLKNAIEFAKSEAFRRNKTITLCPSRHPNTCTYGESWEAGFILFENPQKETQPSAGSVLQIFPGAGYGKIIYNAIGNQLNIHPDGSTTNIGSFVYCAKHPGILKPKGLVLNWATRVYPTEENASKEIASICSN